MSKSTTPRLCPKNPTPKDMSKEWRVWFRYFDQAKGQYVIISRRKSLNDCKDFKDRMAQAKSLISILNDRLSFGWNPITNTYPEKSFEEIEFANMPFGEALSFAYDKKLKHWSEKSAKDYKSVITYLKKYIDEGKRFSPISQLKRIDFKVLLETVYDSRKLSNKGFNKYREYLSSLISELVEWDVMEYNPIRDIKTKPIQKTISHRPPSQDQRLLIVDRIKSKNRNYYRFISLIYGCGMRPKEITRLKIKHLHKLENMFRLTSDVTKSRNDRDVIIPNWLMDLLSEMNLHKYDPEFYIFSGAGNMFMPGKKKMGDNTHTSYWHRIVKGKKEKGGLELDVNQYSLKKLSGDDMIKLQRREGVINLLQLPQLQFGHEDKNMTEVYVNEHKEVLKEVIVNHMPVL